MVSFGGYDMADNDSKPGSAEDQSWDDLLSSGSADDIRTRL